MHCFSANGVEDDQDQVFLNSVKKLQAFLPERQDFGRGFLENKIITFLSPATPGYSIKVNFCVEDHFGPGFQVLENECFPLCFGMCGQCPRIQRCQGDDGIQCEKVAIKYSLHAVQPVSNMGSDSAHPVLYIGSSIAHLEPKLQPFEDKSLFVGISATWSGFGYRRDYRDYYDEGGG